MHAIATVALAASAAAVATRPWRSWPERALDQALRECPHENLIGAAVIVTWRRLRCGQSARASNRDLLPAMLASSSGREGAPPAARFSFRVIGEPSQSHSGGAGQA